MRKPSRRSPSPSAGLALVQGQQWAITESGWRALLKAATSRIAPKALQAVDDDTVEGVPGGLTLRDGIATIRVCGPLMLEDNWLSRYFGWSTYETLARAYAYALGEPSVRAILFEVNSPGGAVSGVSELAAMFYAGREQKPQESFVTGLCCSAALWLASAIGPIATTDVGLLGSIGTMFTYYDTTKYDQKLGIRERTVISRQTPKKNADPNTSDGKSELQDVADELADVFIDALARYRAVSRDTVLSDFGQGAVFVGASAVDAGIADDVTTEVAVIQELLAELDASTGLLATQPVIGGRASTSTTTEAGMAKSTARAGRRSAPQGTAAADGAAAMDTEIEEIPAGAGAVAAESAAPTADAATKSTGKKAVAETTADDNDDDDEGEDGDDTPEKKDADARTTLIAQAKAEERDRVKKIRALAAPADVIEACVDDPDCSPSDAAYRILTGAASATPATPATPAKSRLAALRADDAGPHASATAPKTLPTTPKEAAKASVDRYNLLTKPGKGVNSRTA